MSNSYTLTLVEARIRDGQKESSFEIKLGVDVIGGISVLGYDDNPETGETAEQARDRMLKAKLKRILPKLLKKAGKPLPEPEEEHPAMSASLTITDDELKAIEG